LTASVLEAFQATLENPPIARVVEAFQASLENLPSTSSLEAFQVEPGRWASREALSDAGSPAEDQLSSSASPQERLDPVPELLQAVARLLSEMRDLQEVGNRDAARSNMVALILAAAALGLILIPGLLT